MERPKKDGLVKVTEVRVEEEKQETAKFKQKDVQETKAGYKSICLKTYTHVHIYTRKTHQEESPEHINNSYWLQRDYW